MNIKQMMTLWFLLLTLASEASERRGRGFVSPAFGMEWGYKASIFSHHSSVYRTEDGQYLVEHNEHKIRYGTNGELLAHAGVYLGRHFALSLYGGYEGIRRNLRVISILPRGTFYFKDKDDSGNFLYAGCGYGITSAKTKDAILGKIGFGYRYNAGNGLKIDIQASLDGAYAHPEVYDKYADVFVKPENLGSSNATLLGISLSLALCF